MKILVTGASGLLGSNLVRLLQERGHEVRAFLHRHLDYPSLRGVDMERIYGNVLAPETIAPAIQGCEAVIHAAASTSVWPGRSETVRNINVHGTRHMVEAAKKHEIQRFIHISSGGVFGPGSKTIPGDEAKPYEGFQYGLDYIDSKYKAQQIVLQAIKKDGLPAIIINPTFIFGPYDAKPSSGKMILAIYKRQVLVCPKGGKNFVHAQDIAAATANALTLGRIGQCYIAGNQNLSYREVTHAVGRVLNVAVPKWEAPRFIVKTIGYLGSAYGALVKRNPGLSYPMAKMACDDHYYSAQKAVRELNMPQTDIQVAIQEAFEWFRKVGMA